MRILPVTLAATLLLAAQAPDSAQACGGFFCSQSPVDQNAERIVFAVNDDGTTDMIVQIAYAGSSEDFAWLLPLTEVPDPDKLATFPDAAISALDVGTEPRFHMHPECGWGWPEATTAVAGGFDDDSADSEEPGGVSVYIRQVVGDYDVAVIGSDDAEATSEWLKENHYRITEPMNDFIKLYTAEKLKFLALKLVDEADVSDIVPFRLRLPGDSPSIPLRLTSIASMPEMSILAWVFADQRFEPAGMAREVEVDTDKLRWGGYPDWTNWKKLVAEAVDQADGRGWVVEQAGPLDGLREAVTSQDLDPEDPNYEAQMALTELLAGRSYMTRLHTRLSPEEMTYDPIFKKSAKDDVSRDWELPYVEELCDDDYENDELDPCDFNPCGAYGLCSPLEATDEQPAMAACACVPGFTARSLPSADAFEPVQVACIDERLSFLNPGDADALGNKLADPCVGYDCGENGRCVSMNMAPTCECDQGYVAGPTRQGDSTLRCVKPTKSIPQSFYTKKRPERQLPAGREVEVPEAPEVQVVTIRESSGCSLGGSTSASGGLSTAALFGLWWGVRRRRGAKG